MLECEPDVINAVPKLVLGGHVDSRGVEGQHSLPLTEEEAGSRGGRRVPRAHTGSERAETTARAAAVCLAISIKIATD